MAHWAKLDENNIVEQVIVTENNDDEGKQWISDNLEGRWVKTSYNTSRNRHSLGGVPFRKNFGQVGFIYDETIDGFIPPKKDGEENFIVDPEQGIWVPPVPFPADAGWVLQYGYDPEFQEIEKTNFKGESFTSAIPIIPEGTFVYSWNVETSSWDKL